MFEKLTNRYYYGKSGQGDFTPADLPKTRSGLFWEMLKIRLSGLVRLNLIYVVSWIPAIAVLFISVFGMLSVLNNESLDAQMIREQLQSLITTTLMLLFPCIAVTGPATAGAAYVTRNWARDEHAFLWSDFKDAVRENWKQALLISTITGAVPVLGWISWLFYGQMAASQPVMIVPQMITLMIVLCWSISVTYMHPLIVCYQLRTRDVIRNGLLLGIAKLPLSVGVRLLHAVPAVIAIVAALYWSPAWSMALLLLWYVLIGLSLSRFVSASVSNAVFDKVINSRIPGARVDRGLNTNDDDED